MCDRIACPHAHLLFCHFQFLHVGASHWHCLHPLQLSWLNDRIVDLSLHTWWYSLVANIFLQIFHPYCVLLFTSVFVSPSHCRVLPSYLNSVTFGSWEDCILTLPNGVPFRHTYSLFALDTYIPLFSRRSSCNSSTSFALAHSTTSSANISCQGASFLMFSASESIMMANRKGLKVDSWRRPTSTAKGSLVPAPAAHLTTVSH